MFGGIDYNPIGLAVRRRSRHLLKCLRDRIEAANLVRIKLREPDHSVMVNSHIPRPSIRRWNGPPLERIIAGIKHTNGVIHRHRKPQSSLRIECQEERLRIAGGELVGSSPT